MNETSTLHAKPLWVQRARQFGARISVSVLNQVIGSGANFALGLYLVRALTPIEFGLYGIGMAVCLLYAGFGNALFLTQMVVHLPDKRDDARAVYAASVLALLGLFSATTLVLAGVLYLLVIATDWPVVDMSQLVLAVAAASIANLLKNYFVTLAYSQWQAHKALAVNLAWAAALLLLLFVMHDGGWISDAASALWIFAATSLVAAIFGLGIMSVPLKAIRWQAMRHDFTEAYVGGRWALGGTTIIWLQSQSYMYLTTLLVGPTGVALANASRMLIAPFTFLLPALTQLLLPHLAELRNSDKGEMFRVGQLYTALLIGMGALYFLVLWLGAAKLIPLFVGEKYPVEAIYPLVMAWGCVLLFQLARDGASLTMQALKAFRSLTLVNAVTAAIAIATTLTLALTLGIPGAILGVGVGEALFAASLWHLIQRGRKIHDCL